jgi:hypothetical protein
MRVELGLLGRFAANVHGRDSAVVPIRGAAQPHAPGDAQARVVIAR